MQSGMRHLFALLTLLAWSGTHPLFAEKPGDSAPLRGIVLVISDGTSQELLTAARVYSQGVEGRLAIDDFPQTAFVRTYSLSDLVTDSSSAATAMARGIKADNKVVGQALPSSTSSPESLLDIAKKRGWSTAVVTDDTVTGGTPSPFIVEHPERREEQFIARKTVDRMGSRVDIVVGGGSKWFQDESARPEVSYRPGERKVVAETQAALAASNTRFFTDWDAFAKYADGPVDDRPILATVTPDLFSYYADGLRTLRLRDLVEKTVQLLEKRGRPFLLVWEASLPDKAVHRNNAKRAIIEVLEMDSTMDWLRKKIGSDTLIVATTDHNNGGFSFNGYIPAQVKGDALLRRNPLTQAYPFTFASGPGANFQAANTRLRTVQNPGEAAKSVSETIPETDPEFVQPALVEVSSAFHTGGDVWLIAQGPESGRFRGLIDNTDIFKILADILRGNE